MWQCLPIRHCTGIIKKTGEIKQLNKSSPFDFNDFWHRYISFSSFSSISTKIFLAKMIGCYFVNLWSQYTQVGKFGHNTLGGLGSAEQKHSYFLLHIQPKKWKWANFNIFEASKCTKCCIHLQNMYVDFNIVVIDLKHLLSNEWWFTDFIKKHSVICL